MWKTKVFPFKTLDAEGVINAQKALAKWLERNNNNIHWTPILVNNGLGITYKPLRKIC